MNWHKQKSDHRGEAPDIHPGNGMLVAVEVLMVALLAFAPMAFGAVEAWSEQVVIGLVGLMVAMVLVRALIYRKSELAWSWTYLPMILFLGWAALQLVPLPAGLVKFVSPGTVSLRSELLAGVAGADAAQGNMTLSLYPHGTRHDLRMLLAIAGVFFVVLNVYQRPNAIKRLLIAIVAIGAVVIALALGQDLTGATRVYWTGPLGRGRATAGPFIHYSHFGQFVNMSIGAALGLAIVLLHKVFRRHGMSAAEIQDRIHHPQMRAVWILSAIMIAGVVSVLLSGSRGATIAIAVALGFAIFGLSRNRKLKQLGWVVVGAVVVIAATALLFEFEGITGKMESLKAGDQLAQRWQILKDLTVSWARFPVTGTGLGTHEFVFPMFDRSTVLELATHAENEYAQLLEETGVVGLGLCGLFLAMIWVNWGRAVRGGGRSVQVAAVGLGCGLVAILVNSLVDFGQHTAANACLTAVCCGLIVNLSKLGAKREDEIPVVKLTGHGWMFGRAAMLAGVMLALGWAMLAADRETRAQKAWASAKLVGAHLAQAGEIGSNQEYAELLLNAEAAVAAAPDNVTYGYQLNYLRWRSISRVQDDGAVVLTPASMAYAKRIVGELHQLRPLCPTYGAPVLLAGQLEESILKDKGRGSEAYLTAFKLSPGDPTACLLAAKVDVRQGRYDDAVKKLERYLQRSGGFSEVAELLAVEGRRPELVMDLAHDNYDWLLAAGTVLGRPDVSPALAAQANRRALALLRTRCEASDVPAELLIRLAKEDYRRKDLAGAAECYKRALLLDYGQVEWRMDLARVLAEENRIPEAMSEVRVCLRLREEYADAKVLLGELSLRPGAKLE